MTGTIPSKLGKLTELTRLLGNVPLELVSLTDMEIRHQVDETGETFEQNAALKAETYARLSALPTLADDSGLEVDALDGSSSRAIDTIPRTCAVSLNSGSRFRMKRCWRSVSGSRRVGRCPA